MELKPAEILNLPNAITAASFVGRAWGARHMDTVPGAVTLLVSMAMDGVDGAVARATGQVTELGTIIDPVVDRAGLALFCYNAWQKGIVPKALLAAMGAQELGNASATLAAQYRHPELKQSPTTSGKWGAGLKYAAAGCYVVGNLIRDSHPRTTKSLRLAGAAAGITGTILGACAGAAYLKRAR